MSQVFKLHKQAYQMLLTQDRVHFLERQHHHQRRLPGLLLLHPLQPRNLDEVSMQATVEVTLQRSMTCKAILTMVVEATQMTTMMKMIQKIP
jgi:hypothetical protein